MQLSCVSFALVLKDPAKKLKKVLHLGTSGCTGVNSKVRLDHSSTSLKGLLLECVPDRMPSWSREKFMPSLHLQGRHSFTS